MEDVLAEGTRYWGVYSGGNLIGVIGCEYQGRYGLLRTAFVLDEYRGNGIAAKLTETVFDAARNMGLDAAYLFSTDAGRIGSSRDSRLYRCKKQLRNCMTAIR